jgi:hypothetical protein
LAVEKQDEPNINVYSDDEARIELTPEGLTRLLDRVEMAEARFAALSPAEQAAREAEWRAQGALALEQIQFTRPRKLASV